MAIALPDHTPNLLPKSPTFQPPNQILHMRPGGNHPVTIAMQHQNPAPAHLVANPGQLLVAFGMPSRRDGLQHEPGAREPGLCREKAFAQLERGEAVAVGRERAAGVRRREPIQGEEARFYGGQLGVDGAGDSA